MAISHWAVPRRQLIGWLFIWLSLDAVIAAPRDAVFLHAGQGAAGSISATEPAKLDPSFFVKALDNPAIVGEMVHDSNLPESERNEWAKVKFLLELYKQHGISEKIKSFWNVPGVSESVVAIVDKMHNGQSENLEQAMSDIIKTIPSQPSNSSSFDLQMLAEIGAKPFAPPPAAFMFPLPAQHWGGMNCDATLNCDNRILSGISLTKSCPIGSVCEFRCPVGSSVNPQVNLTCNCDPFMNQGLPFLATTQPSEPFCVGPVANETVTPIPTFDAFSGCLGWDSLHEQFMLHCMNETGCPKDTDSGCCAILQVYRTCPQTQAYWSVPRNTSCTITSSSILRSYDSMCGIYPGQCPIPEDLAAKHMHLNCLNMGYLGNGAICAASCLPGFVNANPTAVSQFSCAQGKLIVPGIECKELGCRAPLVLPLGAQYTSCQPGALMQPGSQCQLTCAPGFTRALNTGSFALSCSRGVANFPADFCKLPSCVAPKLPGNLRYEEGGCRANTDVGKTGTCKVVCRDGYGFANKASAITITCDGHGMLPPTDTCQPQLCTLPKTLPSNTVLHPDSKCTLGGSLAGKELCRVICKGGYEANAGTSASTDFECRAGVLRTPQLKCHEKPCAIPENAASMVFEPEQPAYCAFGQTMPSGTLCRTNCADGYSTPIEPKDNGYACHLGVLKLPLVGCYVNEDNPMLKNCTAVKSGLCNRDFVTCFADAKARLTTTNTDNVCMCYNDYLTCLGQAKDCLDTSAANPNIRVISQICSADCRPAFKDAMGTCSNTAHTCLTSTPSATCCKFMEVASSKCSVFAEEYTPAMTWLYGRVSGSTSCDHPVFTVSKFPAHMCNITTPSSNATSQTAQNTTSTSPIGPNATVMQQDTSSVSEFPSRLPSASAALGDTIANGIPADPMTPIRKQMNFRNRNSDSDSKGASSFSLIPTSLGDGSISPRTILFAGLLGGATALVLRGRKTSAQVVDDQTTDGDPELPNRLD